MSWFRKRPTPSAQSAASPRPQAESAAKPQETRAEKWAAYPRSALILAGLGGATLTAVGLWAIQSFFAPFFLALVLTICAHPIRVALERWGVARGFATGSVITVVFLMLAAFVVALVVAFGQFAALLPQFGPQIIDIGSQIADWLKSIGLTQDQVSSITSSFDPGRILGFVAALLGNVTNVTVGLVIILTSLILMAMDAAYVPLLMRQVGRTKPHMVSALAGFATGVRRYVVATTALGIAQGLLNWVALVILGIPGAFLWGLLSFLCSYIPNIGYFIAIIPPIVFGLLVGGWPVVIAVVIIYGVINAMVQSLIQPRVVGNAVALGQTITFVSVLFWAVVIGPIGAILAIPLTLLVRAILIDSNPAAAWWRPVIGDLAETKRIMKDEDLRSKQAKKSSPRRRSPGEAEATKPETDPKPSTPG